MDTMLDSMEPGTTSGAISLTPEEVSRLAGLCEQRIVLYRFFASIFRKELTARDIEGLSKQHIEMGLSGSLLAQGCSELNAYLQHRGPDAQTDLAVDYARIFLAAGTYEGDTAVPYESVFTSEEHLVMQDARDEVCRIYLAQGIQVDGKLRTPEDHLSFELEFLSIMSERTMALLNDGDVEGACQKLRVQESFLESHILNWIGDLATQARAFAKHPFYPAIMKMLRGFTQEDVATIHETVAAGAC